MATLKYRTADGSYIAIPAMQGPVGPTGNGIKSIKQTTTSSASSGNNVWTVTLTDGTTSTLTVKNGAQGATGPAGGLKDIANASTAGYLTVTKADSTTKNIGGFLPLTGGTVNGTIRADAVYGAVWNDYAEFRNQCEELKPGYIVYCDDDGKLKYTTQHLQRFEGVVSDTYGFAIGQTDECRTPLAVSGRALVYTDPSEDFHSGDCVCAGPGGLAQKMSREEIITYPERIVGVVSEIPTYKSWGKNVQVNGRVWIKIR